MKYNPDKHHRRSTRLKGYDYSSSGAYFITICTDQRQCLFGTVVDSKMELNNIGQITVDEWMRSAEIRSEIEFDEWIVMPNHIHGILVINQSVAVGANGCSPLQGSAPAMKPRSLSSLIAGFKSATTKRINVIRNAAGTPV